MESHFFIDFSIYVLYSTCLQELKLKSSAKPRLEPMAQHFIYVFIPEKIGCEWKIGSGCEIFYKSRVPRQVYIHPVRYPGNPEIVDKIKNFVCTVLVFKGIYLQQSGQQN